MLIVLIFVPIGSIHFLSIESMPQRMPCSAAIVPAVQSVASPN